MSVHKKANGTWFVQYRVPGEKSPRREYCGVGKAGEQKARIRDAEIRLLKTKGQDVAPVAGKVYLDSLAQAYLTERKMRGASARWLNEFAHLLNLYILPAFALRPMEALTYPDVVTFVENTWGKRSLPTRQRYLAYLKAVFRFGVEHGLTANNPLAKWRKSKEKKRELQLTLKDLGTIMAYAAPHLVWAIELEWEMGTRPGPSELLAIRWADVDLGALVVHVRGTKTATSDRFIPITPKFAKRLAAMRKAAQSEYLIEYKGRPVKSLRKAWDRAIERAREDKKLNYRPVMYEIRHLFATTMLANGSDLAAVSGLLGHAAITTTQDSYYHILKGEKRRAIRSRPALKVSQKAGHTKGIQGDKKAAKTGGTKKAGRKKNE